jgi:hypothetical protein
MSYSIEILPTVKLSNEWQVEIINIMSHDASMCSIGGVSKSYFYFEVNGLRTFDFWLSEKEPSIFPDSTYIEGFEHSEKINLEIFLERFVNVPYSIRLESKPTRRENELELMIKMASALAKITNGLVLFEQNLFGYNSSILYLSEDLEHQK